jgi:hypothetical protein
VYQYIDKYLSYKLPIVFCTNAWYNKYMDKNSPTYTRHEAMDALGITSNNAFHSLRRAYPQAFAIIHQGTGKGDVTLYDKETLDKFIQWRKAKKEYKP